MSVQKRRNEEVIKHMEKENIKLKKSYLCKLKNGVNMENNTLVLMIYNKRMIKVGFHTAPKGNLGRNKMGTNLEKPYLLGF